MRRSFLVYQNKEQLKFVVYNNENYISCFCLLKINLVYWKYHLYWNKEQNM